MRAKWKILTLVGVVFWGCRELTGENMFIVHKQWSFIYFSCRKFLFAVIAISHVSLHGSANHFQGSHWNLELFLRLKYYLQDPAHDSSKVVARKLLLCQRINVTAVILFNIRIAKRDVDYSTALISIFVSKKRLVIENT